MTNRYATIDANEAVASVAYRINELIAIYPITPASPMGEWADSWASSRLPNIWGTPPVVVQMQSEAGAAGAVHGGLQCGSLATTFTASQGLLLMLPNMYKIAGELTPAVIHVAARTVATHALSIFCDHSDVMAARMTGFALVASSSVQEAQDMALVCQAATLQSRVPVLHFFDGFRTSHEIAKIETLDDEILRAVLDEKAIAAHRARALSPDHPVIRGTAQNPDVFFQAREAGNPFYQAFADHFTEALADFAQHTGRHYRPFEYYGDQQAERVVVLMGSASETARETVDYLNARGVRLGVVAVRLYRPFDGERFVAALPTSVRAVAVLDRTKEPGATGEPLYLDCVAALHEAVAAGRWEHGQPPRVVGGRYGLSSKEFTPAMVRSVFEQLEHASVRHRFTVGINDDVSHSSLDYDPAWTIESDDVYRAIFHGLGSDGTVSANKNTIKIIGQETDFHVQGYFVYDSKKAGAVTISHLRFGPCPIRSTYLIQQAQLVACHQPSFLDRYDLFEPLVAGGTVLLNHLSPPDELFATLPPRVQQQLLTKRARLFTIDASKVARECGMAGRINVVMQVCFFTVSEVLPREKALQAIRHSIEKTYRSKGEVVVAMNLAAVDATLAQLHEVELPRMPPPQSKAAPSDNGTTTAAPALVRDVLLPILHRCGDQLPVSALPVDGTFPTGTSAWEKRNLAAEIPVWDADICIQCGKCVIVCPHATIRSKVFAPEMLTAAPTTFQSAEARDRAWNGLRYSIQVAPEDCTGCGICVDVCPVRNKSQARCKALNMRPQPPIREQERDNWNFFLSLGEADRRGLQTSSVHQQQIQQPLFEFSGACAGCGETPYLKLLTQLFGDRLLIANATGCSSIYGGNLPTTPWAQNADGRGPAWANSLFEDNAEFGLGFRLSIDHQRAMATQLLQTLAEELGSELVAQILAAQQRDECDIYEQRQRVDQIKRRLTAIDSAAARRLETLIDTLIKKSVWIVGGDGWGYDIGFGGLDHVLASGHDVNILLLDTEVYSNTGGQASKSTPRGAVAKFASCGKRSAKKDLGLMAMTYQNVYVARVAMGARDEHTLHALLEAEAYPGPSLIIAYSHCVAHGIDMTAAMQNQKAAVDSGQWLLYRYHPDRLGEGKNPLRIDSRPPKVRVEDYMRHENRFRMLHYSQPEVARQLLEQAQRDAIERRKLYEYLAALPVVPGTTISLSTEPGTEEPSTR